VQGRLQRGFEGMIRWLRPMTAANSSSDQARFTLPGEQHQQPDSRCQASSTSNQAKVTVPLACH
jgi:hypothetical protein